MASKKNYSIACPFCSKEVTSGQLFRHIWRFHELELLNFKGEGVQNFQRIEQYASGFSLLPIHFSMPKGAFLHCCFGCMKGYKKEGFDSHHQKCRVDHLAKLKAIWTQYQEVLPSAPATPVAVAAPAPVAATVVIDETLQKAFWQALKDNYALRRDTTKADDWENAIREHFEENSTLRADVWEDMEPERPVLYLDEGVPKEIDVASLIRKFEKDPDLYLDRLEPRRPPKKPEATPPPLHPPPPPKKPDAIPEPPKKPVEQPSLPTYTYISPPSQPSYPPILANTKLSFRK
jgi:hypothetical protein